MASYEKTTIYRFMIEDLKLKGNDLLIYSIIFEHSNDGVNCYANTIDYLSKFIDVDTKSIESAIKKLIQKELIIEDKKNKGYMANMEIFKNQVSDVPIQKRKHRKPSLADVEKECKDKCLKYVSPIKFYNHYEEERWICQGKKIGSRKWKDVLSAWNTNAEKYQKERDSRQLDLTFLKEYEKNPNPSIDAQQEYESILKREEERKNRIQKYQQKENQK